ncbi:uncharacterized protein STAUR_5326 [Stigmatella aurantiaca DW4/3-1]|uniref:Uncharacterized protein n=1 Tax=Stigmatella aurantiaca (strain DW4/3-1) TaxID=378806 RepID=E3FMY2_STIAD|nr:uncharacterized protein STAUR_5326 [Stigmatella aurantiaca DW4/3-1]
MPVPNTSPYDDLSKEHLDAMRVRAEDLASYGLWMEDPSSRDDTDAGNRRAGLMRSPSSGGISVSGRDSRSRSSNGAHGATFSGFSAPLSFREMCCAHVSTRTPSSVHPGPGALDSARNKGGTGEEAQRFTTNTWRGPRVSK